MAREGPVPAAWVKHGAPPEAMAAYAEGMCPRHLTQLDAGMFRTGGKGTMPLRWIPGGWCDACRAWWSRPYWVIAYPATAGLSATWDTAEDPAAPRAAGPSDPGPTAGTGTT